MQCTEYPKLVESIPSQTFLMYVFLIGKFNALGSLSEDESEDSEEEEEGGDSESEKGSDSQGEGEQDSEEEIVEVTSTSSGVTVEEFLRLPTADNFLALGEYRADLILKEATVRNNNKNNIFDMWTKLLFSEKFRLVFRDFCSCIDEGFCTGYQQQWESGRSRFKVYGTFVQRAVHMGAKVGENFYLE